MSNIDQLNKHAKDIRSNKVIISANSIEEALDTKKLTKCSKCHHEALYVCSFVGKESLRCEFCKNAFVRKNGLLPNELWFVKTIKDYEMLKSK